MTTQHHEIAHTNASPGRAEIVCTCGRGFAGSNYDVAEEIWRAHRTTAQQQIDAADAAFPTRARVAAQTIREAIDLGYVGTIGGALRPSDLDRIADEHEQKEAETAAIEGLAADIDAAIDAYIDERINNSAIARELYGAGWRRTETP